jgi:hypothetical protein
MALLIVVAAGVCGLGLLALGAAARSSQCSRRLEAPRSAQAVPPRVLPRLRRSA